MKLDVGVTDGVLLPLPVDDGVGESELVGVGVDVPVVVGD